MPDGKSSRNVLLHCGTWPHASVSWLSQTNGRVRKEKGLAVQWGIDGGCQGVERVGHSTSHPNVGVQYNGTLAAVEEKLPIS